MITIQSGQKNSLKLSCKYSNELCVGYAVYWFCYTEYVNMAVNRRLKYTYTLQQWSEDKQKYDFYNT